MLLSSTTRLGQTAAMISSLVTTWPRAAARAERTSKALLLSTIAAPSARNSRCRRSRRKRPNVISCAPDIQTDTTIQNNYAPESGNLGQSITTVQQCVGDSRQREMDNAAP